MTRYVVALMGLPGAGKSTVARFLLGRSGLQEVNRDTIRHAMFPACRYTRAENDAAERALMSAVEVNCAAGLDSLIDGMTFASGESLQRLRELGERLGFATLVLWLDCPVAVARHRVAADMAAANHAAADRNPDLVDAVARRFDTPSPDATRIDATQPASEVCAQALAAVDEIAGR